MQQHHNVTLVLGPSLAALLHFGNMSPKGEKNFDLHRSGPVAARF